MSSIALRLPRAFNGPGACLLASGIQVLHALVADASNIFILALGAMLFRPPDLKSFPIDRVAFGILCGVCLLRACVTGDHFRLHSASWPLLASLLLAGSTLVGQPYHAEAWSVFAAKWIVPVTLFHFGAIAFHDERSLRKLELFCLCVLGYLTIVSVCFLLDYRGLILPRFILDESIGIHADRARGPFLQAVANGVCITLLALIGLHSYERGRLRGIWAVLLLTGVPVALLATRTRAVWLSAALALAWMAVSRPSPHARRIAVYLCGFIVAGSTITLLCNQDWTQLHERLQDRSPVEFRAEMYRAGWQMFSEHPFTGWGGDDQVQPELEKRVTGFHSDYYVFHNTYLEIAVGRGALGLIAYAWVMLTFFRLGLWKQERHTVTTQFLGRSFRRLWPIALTVYLLNASAVVMNYQFLNGLLFTIAGILSAQDDADGDGCTGRSDNTYENCVFVE